MAEQKKKNKNLNTAKKAKNDEFYTRLEDISNELCHYNGILPTGSTNHFRGKTVLCNCDDAKESNFFKYFALNFNFLGLKKLICVGYAGSGIKSCFDKGDERHSWKIEIDHMDDFNGDSAVDFMDAEWLIENQKGVLTQMKGDGDFRSEESIELLKQADIVVTNPPFSLFREYVAQLMTYQKQFIIWGNNNAITYKEIFSLIKDNKLWLGYTVHQNCYFVVPDSCEVYDEKYTAERHKANPNDKQKYAMAGPISVFTNIPLNKRHENLVLAGNYSLDSKKYPKYDNYDAIEVSKVSLIPRDYMEIMGVPITFMEKYNPDQFEIIGLDRYVADNPNPGHRFELGGKEVYARILIRRQPGSSDGWTA